MRCLFFLALAACGARTEIAGDEPQQLDAASGVDVTSGDSKSDAPVIVKDAGADAAASQPCCDEGVKKSGCQQCAGDETCWTKVGTCITPVADCGPTTCDGCCLTTTECSDGKEVGACGNAGQLCQTCIDTAAKTYGSCVAQTRGGVCMGGPTCTPTNCDGCCDGDICMLGNTDTSCGTSGNACTVCTSGASFCSAGKCVSTKH